MPRNKAVDARLTKLERRAPSSFKTLTIETVVVEPNPVPDGPPVECGPHTRFRRTAPRCSVHLTFAPPPPGGSTAEPRVIERRRYVNGTGVGERFDPPVAESELPDAPVPEAVERFKSHHVGKAPPGV